jgi:hypothetical protein
MATSQMDPETGAPPFGDERWAHTLSKAAETLPLLSSVLELQLASCIPATNVVIKATATMLDGGQTSPALVEAWAALTCGTLAVLHRAQGGQPNAKRLLTTVCARLLPNLVRLRHVSCERGRKDIVASLDAITMDSLFHAENLGQYPSAMHLPPLYLRRREKKQGTNNDADESEDDGDAPDDGPAPKKAAINRAEAGEVAPRHKLSYPRHVFEALGELLANDENHDAACGWMPQIVHQFAAAAQRAAQAKEGKSGGTALSWYAVATAIHVDPRDVLFNLVREVHALLDIGAERQHARRQGATRMALFARTLTALKEENGFDEAFDKATASYTFSAWGRQTLQDLLQHVMGAQAEEPSTRTLQWLESAWAAITELVRCSQTFAATIGPLLFTAALQRMCPRVRAGRGADADFGAYGLDDEVRLLLGAVVQARIVAVSVWTEAYSDLRQLEAVVKAVVEAGEQWATTDFLPADGTTFVGAFSARLPFSSSGWDDSDDASPGASSAVTWDEAAWRTFQGWLGTMALSVEEQPPRLGPRLLQQLIDAVAINMRLALESEAPRRATASVTLLIDLTRSVACHMHVTPLTVGDIVEALGNLANKVLGPNVGQGHAAVQVALEAPLCELVCDALELAQVARRVDPRVCEDDLLQMLSAWRDSIFKQGQATAGRNRASAPGTKAMPHTARLALDGQLIRQHILLLSGPAETPEAQRGTHQPIHEQVLAAARRKAQAIIDGDHGSLADALVDLKLLASIVDHATLTAVARSVARLACQIDHTASALGPHQIVPAYPEAHAFAASPTLPELLAWQAPWVLALVEQIGGAFSTIPDAQPLLQMTQDAASDSLQGQPMPSLANLGGVYQKVGMAAGWIERDV